MRAGRLLRQIARDNVTANSPERIAERIAYNKACEVVNAEQPTEADLANPREWIDRRRQKINELRDIFLAEASR